MKRAAANLFIAFYFANEAGVGNEER